MMILRSWSIPDEVDNLQDTECVHYEECDEPPFLFILSSVPERIAFEDDSPDCDDDKKRHNAE